MSTDRDESRDTEALLAEADNGDGTAADYGADDVVEPYEFAAPLEDAEVGEDGD